MLVFADWMPETMLLIVDGADVGASDDAAPESRPFRLDGDMADADVDPRWDRSPTKAPIPCPAPLTKRGPSAVVSLSGGKNPNGVGTLAGLVDQPKLGSP